MCTVIANWFVAKEERAQLNEKLARVAAEKGELEHALVQLQEENESIADYVSLYREQRSALIAKQNRREQMLHTLLHERKLLSVCTVHVSSYLKKVIIDIIDNNLPGERITPAHTCTSSNSDSIVTDQ